jgi:hypothetical protein
LRVSAAKIAAEYGNISLAKTTYLPRSDFFWQTNWASGQEELLWKKKVFFEKVVGQYLHANFETRDN